MVTQITVTQKKIHHAARDGDTFWTGLTERWPLGHSHLKDEKDLTDRWGKKGSME